MSIRAEAGVALIGSSELETIAEGVDSVPGQPYGRAWDVIDRVRERMREQVATCAHRGDAPMPAGTVLLALLSTPDEEGARFTANVCIACFQRFCLLVREVQG